MGRDAVVLLLLEIENNCSTNKKSELSGLVRLLF